MFQKTKNIESGTCNPSSMLTIRRFICPLAPLRSVKSWDSMWREQQHFTLYTTCPLTTRTKYWYICYDKNSKYTNAHLEWTLLATKKPRKGYKHGCILRTRKILTFQPEVYAVMGRPTQTGVNIDLAKKNLTSSYNRFCHVASVQFVPFWCILKHFPSTRIVYI